MTNQDFTVHKIVASLWLCHSQKLRHGHTKYFEIADMDICRNGIEYAKMTQFDFQNLFCNFVFDFSDFFTVGERRGYLVDYTVGDWNWIKF